MTLPHLLPQAAQGARISDVSSMNNKNSSTTNGFQSAISTSNVRVPHEHREQVASITTNGKILISSLLASPKSPTPTVAHPPRTNAQARTARKSAFVSPSSSRGEGGYTTSSSGNSGRKSFSGPISGGDRRERDSLSMSEVSSDSPVRIQAKNRLENPRHAQKRLPPPKPQQVQQSQQPTTTNEDSGPTMLAAAFSAARASDTVAAPAGAVVAPKTSSTKRPPLVLSETISSTKPKRQKIATPKAAALAKVPNMNADGTAVKKRRLPGELSEKDKARERRKAKAIQGSGKFSLNCTIEPVTGATINVATKPQPVSANPPRPRNSHRRPVVPLPPPPYQVPMDRCPERQRTQQETNGSTFPPAAIPNTELRCKHTFQPPKLPVSSKTNGKIPNSSSSSRTQYKAQGNQGNSATEAILINSSPSSVEKKKDNSLSLQNVKRKGLGKPPVYNISSDSNDSAINLRSPESGQNLLCLQTKHPANASSYDNAGALAVTDLLFQRCILSHMAPPGDRRKLCLGIEDIIQRLEFQKDQSRAEGERSKTVRPPVRWSEDGEHPTLENIAALLGRLCVITDDGSIITFKEWKEDTPFKGRFILPEDAEDARSSFKKISSNIAPPDATRPSEMSTRAESREVLVSESPKVPIHSVQSVSGVSSASRSEDSRRDSVVSDSNNTDYSVPDTQESAKTPGEVADGEPSITEGSIASDVVQLVGSLSSSLNVADAVLCGEDVTLRGVSHTRDIEEQDLRTIEEPQEENGEERREPLSQNTDTPMEAIDSSSSSDLIQAQDTPSTIPLPHSPKVDTEQPFVSKKRKKKTFRPVSVEDFLSESIPDKVLQASALLKSRQETGGMYFARILRLKNEERSVKTELDALNASAKAREAEYKRKIDEGVCRANWGQCGKLYRELRDIQGDYARETVRLVDKASRIVEERTWCLAQKKIMEENSVVALEKGQNEESTSSTTASAPSVSDLVDEDSVSVLFRMPPGGDIEGDNMARELLKELIPWSKIQPEPNQSSSSAEEEANAAAAAAAAAAEAKRKMRKKKRHRW